MQAEIEDDEFEAGGDEHLGGSQRVIETLGPQPQQMIEFDAGSYRGLRVELRTLIDEGRGLTGAGHLLQGGDQGREATAGTASHELDKGAAGEAAAEDFVKGCDRGGEGGLVERLRPPPVQLRRAADDPPNLVRQRRVDRAGIDFDGGVGAGVGGVHDVSVGDFWGPLSV